METVLVISAETFSGKSAVCITLGQCMRRHGYRIGYMKPLAMRVRRAEQDAFDEDAAFFKQVFELQEPLEQISPLVVTPRLMEKMLQGEKQPDFVGRLKTAFAAVSHDKDIMLLEGPNDWSEGTIIDLPAAKVAALFGAHVLLVSRFQSLLEVDNILAVREAMGDRGLAGVVLNMVPRARIEVVRRLAVPFLEQQGIPVLATLQQDPLLCAVSVNELTEHLNAEILCCRDHGEDLVETMMVGAMSVDSALSYFRRQANKAVITGGDRVDIQLAALETSTTCLILTGDMRPNPLIVTRAEEQGVPILLVAGDTMTTVRQSEELFGRARFRQTSKIERLESLLETHFDFKRFYEALGLPVKE
jgi:BioD-like phosphotransacetylase family protein